MTVYRFSMTLLTIAQSSVVTLHIANGANHGSPDQLVPFRAYETSTSGGGAQIPDAFGDNAMIMLPAPPAVLALVPAITAIGRRR